MDALDHVRKICMALPEMEERLSHGSPAFFVRGKKTVAMFLDNHHGDGRVAIWCPAPPGVQDDMVRQEPERFFKPPYVGPSGWLGVRLDVDVDWDEVAGIVEDAYRKVAPKKLVALLDAEPAGTPGANADTGRGTGTGTGPA
jgi:hypothetical protein